MSQSLCVLSWVAIQATLNPGIIHINFMSDVNSVQLKYLILGVRMVLRVSLPRFLRRGSNGSQRWLHWLTDSLQINLFGTILSWSSKISAEQCSHSWRGILAGLGHPIFKLPAGLATGPREQGPERGKTCDHYGCYDELIVSLFVWKIQLPALRLCKRYVQTNDSMELHRNSHAASDWGLKGLMRAPLIMAKTMTKIVMENMHAKASFCRRLIWTFHSILIGTRMTKNNYQLTLQVAKAQNEAY